MAMPQRDDLIEEIKRTDLLDRSIIPYNASTIFTSWARMRSSVM